MTRRRLVIAVVLVLALCATMAYVRLLPERLFDQPLSTIILDRKGELLGARIAQDGQWRFPAGEALPEKFVRALIEYEDKRFYSHLGVDPLALGRAAYLDLKARRIVSGGSTLTMQVARLARAREDRGVLDKLIEMMLATRLELTYSKQEILALYAANAPFGGNVVGLEAAAWRYFGRAPELLSWAEACTLAVLPNSPALIHPGRNRAALLGKRDRLLARLHERGAISKLDFELALKEPLPGEPLPLPNEAPHLLDTLRALYPTRHRFQTTLDRAVQRMATSELEAHARRLAARDVYNAAAVVIDNRTFDVLAYVGNADRALTDRHGFAVDIVRRPRSTGSILKPLLYAAMLEAGEILPQTLVPDVPTQYAGYMPENYDRLYRGVVPADVALAQSLNVPAVRMLKQHGVQRFYDLLRHTGMTTLVRPPDDYGLTLILGGAEGTLWDIASQYANLAHIARQIYPGQPINYRRPRVLDSETTETTRAAEIGPASAWLTLRALLEVGRPGEEANWRSFANAKQIAWKTGTSWGLRDAWSIGNTSRFTVGVWVGNASGEGKPGLTGATAAAPLMFAMFGRLPSAEWFVEPTLLMKEVEVCSNDGYLANGACETRKVRVPRSSHFDRLSPYNQRVHLASDSRHRVDSSCESIDRMRHANWFVLPPGAEHFYRRQHANYRSLPAFRADCDGARSAAQAPMDFLYPNAGTKLYIPIDLGTRKGRTVFEAVHRDANATLHWHLDDRYIGETRIYHQQAIDIEPGMHAVTIVDEQGNRVSRRFEVLGR
ncbi:MAG: penicillin-binding protein 1C [Xanthomonadaceae bacterium]|nr:penicillin-binding protein 1C [Xanthomonadaceae bacterium]